MASLKQEELDLLGASVLFRSMSHAALRTVTDDEDCHTARAEKGQVIYGPHDFSHSLGILLSGKVRVSKAGFVVSTLERGDLFGAAALFNNEEDYATTLTARADCHLVFFSQKLMERIMADHIAVAGAYIRYLSGRIRFLEGKLDHLLAGSTQRKLAQFLLERQEGDRVVLDGPVFGLAEGLDVSRAALYRAFDTLTAAGAIVKEGKTVRILKEEKLV